MRLRRYYKKGMKYPYTISEEYLAKLINTKGLEQANKIDNASYELILESDEEQVSWFTDCLIRVIKDPRYYLDNLNNLYEFKVKKRVINAKLYK